MYVCKKNRRHKHVSIGSGAAIDGAPVAAAADADAAVSSDIWFQFTFNFLIAFELLDMYGHAHCIMARDE